jgi:LuxR family maltose regulon positive regulatory protein
MSERAAPTVATSKVRTPGVRPEVVTRDRLSLELDDAVRGPLTVVRAPAGYGKTTALVTWLATVDVDTAWLSVDAGDDDPARFCAHVLAALRGAIGAPFDDAARALAAGSDLLVTVLPLIVNAIEDRATPVLLVLDDLHEVRDPQVHRLVDALLDRAPAALHVVIATRTRPPVRLGRRIAAGQAHEIGPESLAFRGGEADQLLNDSLGLALTREQVDAIDARVEGWPAGLALAASSLGRRPDRDEFVRGFVRSSDAVTAYLTEEVLHDLSPEMRSFLRRTSILPRLVGGLCEAVIEDPRAHDLLHRARAENLFVTAVEDDAPWLRYHPVFADLLREDLRRREPQLIAELHLRASRWFERAGATWEAIEHASLAGDGRRAARLVHDADIYLLVDHQAARTRRLLDRIPEDRGEHGPVCDALYAQSLVMDGAEPALLYERWERLREQRDAPGVARIVDRARIWPFYGRVSSAVEEGWATYERYRDDDPAIYHSIAATLGLTLAFAGEWAQARRIIELHLDAMVFDASKSWALAALSFCAAETGDARLAEQRARQAVAIADAAGGQTALQYSVAYQALANALTYGGDLEGASHVLEQVGLVTGRLPGSLHHALTVGLRARLAKAQRARSPARALAAEARLIVERYPDPGVLTGLVVDLEQQLGERTGERLRGSAPTPAELRLLALLPSPHTFPEIAAELYLSVNTVKSHARRLYRRLGVSGRQEAVARARELGWL